MKLSIEIRIFGLSRERFAAETNEAAAVCMFLPPNRISLIIIILYHIYLAWTVPYIKKEKERAVVHSPSRKSTVVVVADPFTFLFFILFLFFASIIDHINVPQSPIRTYRVYPIKRNQSIQKRFSQNKKNKKRYSTLLFFVCGGVFLALPHIHIRTFLFSKVVEKRE